MSKKKGVDFFWTKQAHESKFGRTAASQEGWYNTTRWRKLRKAVLDEEPLCRMCLKEGKITSATMVDHIIPVKGLSKEDEELFYDIENLQPLCDSCHIKKTKIDHSKFSEENLKKGQQLMDELEN